MVDAAIRGMRLHFEQTEMELQCLSSRLEAGLGKVCSADVDPYRLLQRIEAIQKSLPVLLNDAADVMAAKQDLMETASRHLLAHRARAHELQAAVDLGVANDATDATLRGFREIQSGFGRDMRRVTGEPAPAVAVWQGGEVGAMLKPQELRRELLSSALPRPIGSAAQNTVEEGGEGTAVFGAEGEEAAKRGREDAPEGSTKKAKLSRPRLQRSRTGSRLGLTGSSEGPEPRSRGPPREEACNVLSPNEFATLALAVDVSVRDANDLYRTIFRYFQEKPSAPALSTHKLRQIDSTVTGIEDPRLVVLQQSHRIVLTKFGFLLAEPHQN